MNGRERVLSTIAGQPADHVPFMPITMMFAADQAGIPYGQYACDYRTLVKAQLHTARKFNIDYVSCISDPAREAADCGAVIRYFEDQPPAIDETQALLLEKSRLITLRIPDPLGGGRMDDRIRAADLLKREIGKEKLIEGWVEGPCAEGADLRGINNLMLDFYDDPDFVRDLFAFVLEMELAFGRCQVEAGCDLIGIGDAAASLVGPAVYEEFVLPYEQKLIQGLQSAGAKVRLHICGNTRDLLAAMARTKSEIIDLDFLSPLEAGRRAMGPEQILAGNLDPVRVLRDGDPVTVTREVERCHREAGPRYIVAAGCEIARGTPDANVFALRDYAINTKP